MPRNAHVLVAKVAEEMAEELFELWAQNNVLYAAMQGKKGRRRFVRRVMPSLLEDARASLATLLANAQMTDAQKEEIADALMLDNMLRGNRLVRADTAMGLSH